MYPVNERKIGDNSCPYCNHTKLKSGVNDLTITNPQLASEFSPRNDKKANEVGEWQKYEVFWICPDCGAEYRYIISERSVGDDSCPVCANKRIEKGINDLATTNPEIAALLSPNNERKADTLLPSFKLKVAWICPTCNGEYYAPVEDMVNGLAECPYCSNQKPLAGFNTLKALYPEIADCLSPNNDFTADEILPTSTRNAKWICPTCGGEYYASVKDMIEGASECPYCNDQRPLAGFNTLEALYPEIAEHLSPNNDFSADKILPTSTRNAKWICPTCSGEYSASVKDMVEGIVECPYCNNQRPLAGFNTLKALYPEIADCLSPNNDFTADEILPTRYGNIKWICPTCGGEYYASVKDMIEGASECPYCNDQRPLAGFNTLEALYPEIAEHLSPNNDFSADKILPTSTRNAKWICPTCSGEYSASVKDMVEGIVECPYCNNQRPLAGFNTLKALYPEVAEHLSPNNGFTADKILPTSTRNAKWICPTCSGTYYASVKDMVNGLAKCPYCDNKRHLFGFNTLKALYPVIAEHFSPNNGFTADDILSTSYRLVKWICPTCGGEYSASVKDMVNGHVECPYCNNQKPLAGFNTLKVLYPEIAKQMTPNNDKGPDDVLPTSGYLAEWTCPTCGGEYFASVKDMVNGNVECPYCNNRKPLAGFNTLKVLYPDIAKQMTPNNEKGPDDVLPTSAYFAEWACPICGHKYRFCVQSRVELGNLCPACAGKKAQAGLNSLLDIYPEIQDEWAENENTLLGIFPDEILPTSTARVWWKCKDCGRKYLLGVNMWVEKHNRGITSCTYCKGLRMRETHVLL